MIYGPSYLFGIPLVARFWYQLGMSKTPANLVGLPPNVQAFVAAQVAEMARYEARDVRSLTQPCRSAKAPQG